MTLISVQLGTEYLLYLLLWRSAPVAKKKDKPSIFSSKSAFSDQSNDSGEYQSVSRHSVD